jgi:membrane protein DedA with SNARE-associated domain
MTPDLPSHLPLGFEQWNPIAQALLLGLSTFVQEDLPTITAAILAGAAKLGLAAGFLGCFFGIWIGDLLLYGVARIFGKRILDRAWIKRFADPAAIARSEQWFAQKGIWLLVSSRFVPGTRLPTYLAAGLLRMSLPRFATVTGVVVAFWTSLIFLLAHRFGTQLAIWSQRWNHFGLLLTVGILGLFGLVCGINYLLRHGLIHKSRATFGRWMRWEFWPASLFYLPIVVNYIRLAIRHRGLLVPSAANPGILTGGLVSESKADILDDLQRTSPGFTAATWLISPGPVADRLAQFQQLMSAGDLSYPVILKPDVGQRGVGVKIIRSETEAAAYFKGTTAPLVLQRYVVGPFEVGIFYYRFPSEPHGRIFAITEKIFPVVIGDGVRTIEELIWNDPRARFVAARYLQRFTTRRTEVLPAGATLRLVEAGNHAQGCIFKDGLHLRTSELEAEIDRISQRIDGFFIGRYDIRFNSEADLKAGKNFQIIELNGASAEATSIYDSRNSLADAYRTLFRQWELVFAIGAANRQGGTRTTPIAELIRRWRETNLVIATYPLAD